MYTYTYTYSYIYIYTYPVGISIHQTAQEIEAEAAAWLEEGAHATDDIGRAAVQCVGRVGKN